MKKINQKGFTLIELLVVIAIIGLLSTLAVVALNNARAKARDAKRVADVKQIQTALELYYNECAGYPSTAGGAAILSTDDANSGTCAGSITFGKYMATVPVPPAPGDGSAACVAANTYNYQSCNATGGTCNNTQIASYAIQYCLGETTGSITGDTVHSANPAGMQ